MELKKSGPDTSLRIRRMKRLLVIKPSSLGDIVHALQVVQTFAQERPEWRISWVVRERFAGLVHAAAFVDEVIIFRRRDGWTPFFGLLRELRRQEYDAVWDMQGLLRSGLMTAVARSPEKWGRRDAREGAGWFCNRRVELPPGAGPHHALDILQQYLRSVGVTPRLEFPLQLHASLAYPWQGFFRGEPRNTFLLFTDSRGAEKKWPHFNELTARIFAAVPECRVAWCAGRHKDPEVDLPKERFLNLTGCSMEQMIALVRQPTTFVGNDSGPMHLAAALGHRVLAIFGPSSPRRFGPYPLDAAKHRFVAAPEGRLDKLEPATVLAALLELRSRVL